MNLYGTNIEDDTYFVYLGSKITTEGDSMTDIQAWITKATGVYKLPRKNIKDLSNNCVYLRTSSFKHIRKIP